MNKIPSLQRIMPVYAVTVMMVYGWTLFQFAWRLSSWLYFLRIDEIFGILAYSLATDFLESLVIIVFPVFLCLLLPRRWFYDQFIARGIIVVVLGIGYLMYVASLLNIEEAFPPPFVLELIPVLVLVGLAFMFLVEKVHLAWSLIEAFADRAIIFLYILLPATALSLILILIRNVF